MKTWGLFDRHDGVWIGDDTGPYRYDQESVAWMACEILGERLQLEDGRLTVQPSETADRKRDDVDCKLSLEEATDNISLRKMSAATGIPVEKIRRLESGQQIQSRAEDALMRAYFDGRLEESNK